MAASLMAAHREAAGVEDCVALQLLLGMTVFMVATALRRRHFGAPVQH